MQRSIPTSSRYWLRGARKKDVYKRQGLHRQSAQTLIHHAPDAGVRTENRLKTLLLLLQAMGCKKEKWAGTQAGDSAAVQQKRKLGN